MIFRSPFSFFGLNPEHRNYVFSQIHEIVFHGGGGYSWIDVYNMPIWLRRFTFNKLKTWHDEQAKASKATTDATSRQQKLDRPDIKPSYTSKTSSK